MTSVITMTLTLVLLLAFTLEGVKAVRVETPLGPVEGVATENSEKFLGIKFATADRFAYPVPVSPWQGVYQATQVGPMCAQNCPPIPPKMCLPEMSEDCLYLNVFRPARKSHGPLPVLLFIHGGNFEMYSGGAPLHHGDVIAALANVIVVTINYRLGAFGWLGFVNETGEVTAANYGLEDQRLAMKWVIHNIASFGGDPHEVTLWGQSAGCQSAGLHLASSKSRGLFHRAILQSCPLVLPFRSPREAKEQNSRLSSTVKCPPGDVTCLRSVTSQAIINATRRVTGFSLWGDLLMAFQPWGPVIDSRDVTHRFLRDSLNSTKVEVPVILGTTADEGDIFVAASTLGTISPDLYQVIVTLLWPGHLDSILQHYPAQENDSRPTVARLATDVVFYCPNAALGKWMAGTGARVWQYQFQQPLSFDGFGDEEGMCLGKACHGGDLPFVFATPPNYGINVTMDDQLLSRLLIGYWGDFAHHGNPDGGVVNMTSWPDLSYKDLQGQRLHFQFKSRSFGTIPESKLEACELLNRLPMT